MPKREGQGCLPCAPGKKDSCARTSGRGAATVTSLSPLSPVSSGPCSACGGPRGAKEGRWAPSSPGPGEMGLLLFPEGLPSVSLRGVQVFPGHPVRVVPQFTTARVWVDKESARSCHPQSTHGGLRQCSTAGSLTVSSLFTVLSLGWAVGFGAQGTAALVGSLPPFPLSTFPQCSGACALCASGRGNRDKLEPCPEEPPVPFPGCFIQPLRPPSPLVLYTWLRTQEACSAWGGHRAPSLTPALGGGTRIA